MKHYETIFIINPNLSEEEYGETLTKFRDLIDKVKGIMIKVEEWGKQKLAYQLMRFDSGFYVLIDYCGEPGMTVEFERNLKLDERILKYQTIKLADKADPEALIRKEKENKEELIPLSLARAEAVKQALVKLGLDANRISVVGLGGSSPIVPFDDEENRWKNRLGRAMLKKLKVYAGPDHPHTAQQPQPLPVH